MLEGPLTRSRPRSLPATRSRTRQITPAVSATDGFATRLQGGKFIFAREKGQTTDK